MMITIYLKLVGVFVYRLGHGPLKAERRVRFPYALPTPQPYTKSLAPHTQAFEDFLRLRSCFFREGSE